MMARNIVTASQPLASQAGVQVLADGGNAVDAALAAAITLTIVEPTGNGIGSDAYALIWDNRQLYGINGSGCSPAEWSYEKFSHFESMPKFGWDSVTVPGAVSVWAELSRKFGLLPFERLFEPALDYARNGFPVTPVIAGLWRAAAETYKEYKEFGKVFLPGAKAPAAGDIFKNPLAADTLAEIARTAGESFYRGDLAQAMAHDSARWGGSMSFEDLAAHHPQWVRPISQHYRGRELFEIPPNGQGLAALIAIGILNQFDIGNYPLDSADSVHLQVEAMKLGFADVSSHLADIRSMRVDPLAFLDRNYLARRASTISMDHPLFPDTGIPDEAGTVCLAAADSSGMMVSFIQSNFHGFGSGIVVPGTGISLNNRGFGFTLEEGHPNCVGGGKKPFHTIIPGFVMQDGAPLMSFGVMGAHMQAQGHVQMMTRIFDYEQNPQAASDAPRWHVTADSKLALEGGYTQETIRSLRQRGHSVLTEETGIFGGAQLILRSGDCYCAGSDHRKDGQAAGF